MAENGQSITTSSTADARQAKITTGHRVLGQLKNFTKSLAREMEPSNTTIAKVEQHKPTKLQATQNKPSSATYRPPVVAKAQHSSEQDELESLREDFLKMERGMSSDEPKEPEKGQVPATVTTTATYGTLPMPRQVMDNEHVHPLPLLPPTTARKSSAAVPNPVRDPLTSATMYKPLIVEEPVPIDVNPVGQSRTGPESRYSSRHHNETSIVNGRRPSSSHQRTQACYTGQRVNANQYPSYESLRSELEITQLNEHDLRRQLENMRKIMDEAGSSAENVEPSRESHTKSKHDLEQLQTSHAQTVLENEQLKIAEHELRQEVLIWQGKCDTTRKELLQIQSDLSREVDDPWFLNQWVDIQAKIENMSHEHFAGHLPRPSNSIMNRGKGSSLDKVDNQPSVALQRLSNRYAKYLGSDHDRPLIIQAYVWWVLVNKIFAHTSYDEEGHYWAGQSRDVLNHLKRHIQHQHPKDWSHLDSNGFQRAELNARNYHRWRATTNMLLLATENVDRRIDNTWSIITDIISDMIGVISPYIVLDKLASIASAEEVMRKQLEAILIEAMKTDAEIAQSRARIFCEQWRAPAEGDPLWGFQYDPDDSEISQTSGQAKGRRTHFKEPCVELVIQPALIRHGSQFGESYAVQHVLCKAKVVIGEATFTALKHR